MDQITPGMTYGLTALSLAVYAIPLVIVAYLFIKRVIKAPRAARRASNSFGAFHTRIYRAYAAYPNCAPCG